MTQQWQVQGEAAMEAWGARLGQACPQGAWIYLRGDLGAGKTTLVRGLLRGLGYEGKVKSPTYTLVEPYTLSGHHVHHLDLYRLADPEELAWIGIEEIFQADHLCLVEWPEQGQGVLPVPDVELALEYAGNGRLIQAQARTERGRGVVAQMSSRT